MADDHKPAVNLPVCFLALLAFTAAEIVLYETWRRSAATGDPFMPKFAMVLVLLFVLTLPKAFIVMSYFMHLRFERSLLVLLAVLPFITVAVLILPMTTDIQTLSEHNYTHDDQLPEFAVSHGEHRKAHDGADAHEDGGAEPEGEHP